MSAFNIKIGENIPLTIIPDSMAHVDGHPVLAYTYSIFKSGDHTDPGEWNEMFSQLHLEKHKDPNYLGYVTFEQPGRLFTYTPDGNERLDEEQIEEIIEEITSYRDKPSQWII